MKFPELENLSKEELIEIIVDEAKNWLAHDGLWFQAVERHFGMEAAIKLDAEAWKYFTVVEANRIKERLKLPENSGIEGLEKALNFRMYRRINNQVIERVDENTIILKMVDCRVQSARERKNMPLFPCKSVGIVEYSYFAKAIDERFETEAVSAPPERISNDYYCAWKFTLKK